MSPKEEEMLELAAEHGVKAIILTTHSDCAAEKAAKNPALRARFPELSAAVDERAARARELIERPAIATKIQKGELIVRHAHIDTATDEIIIRH